MLAAPACCAWSVSGQILHSYLTGTPPLYVPPPASSWRNPLCAPGYPLPVPLLDVHNLAHLCIMQQHYLSCLGAPIAEYLCQIHPLERLPFQHHQVHAIDHALTVPWVHVMPKVGFLSGWPVWEGRVRLYLALLHTPTLLLVQRKNKQGIFHPRWETTHEG